MKTLIDILIEYLEYLRSLNYSKHTRRTLLFNIRRAVKWLEAEYGITGPEQLRIRHLRAWQKHLSSSTTSKGHPLKAISVNKHIENMRTFMDHMAKEGFVQTRLAEAVQYVKEPNFLPGGVLPHAQMRKFLDSVSPDTAEGYCMRTMLETLYSTGVRAGELLGSDVDSLDIGNATLRVMGKGSKERVVPVGRTALRFLESYISAIRPYRIHDPAETALFMDNQGRRLPYHTFRRILAACVKSSGFDQHITAHTFRRSCTTEMLRGGAGMYHVKELLGHESLETLKHYAKLTIMDLKATHRRCHPREKDRRD